MKNSWNLLSRLSENLVPLVLVSIIIPALFVLAAGFYFIFSEGYLLYFIGFLSFITLILFFIYLENKKKKGMPLENEILIESSPQSSEFDNEIRKKIYKLIDRKIEKGIEWNEFQTYTFRLVSEIASFYNPKQSEKELAFSIPEVLLALETLSSKYRTIMIEYVPSVVHQIPISFYKQAWEHRAKATAVGRLYDVYRAWRVTSPAGMLSELTSQLRNKVLNNATSSVENKIKKALLQELTSVSIELYRGGYKLKDNELKNSKVAAADKMNQAKNIEPLRVLLVGQVSAGKSSVINALIDKTVAEVSIIPSTDKTIVHNWKIDNKEVIKLVDLPGLDGSIEINELILKEMTESDLIFWVLKANQSARKLDSQLKIQFDDFYKKRENITRKKPTVIALVNQVDKLQPINEWNPPYNVTNCNPDDKKACVIRDAINYNQALLKPNHILALSLKENQQFNLDEVRRLLQKAYENGIHTQLNRRKHEDNSDGVLESGEKVWKTAKTLFKL